MATNGDSPVLSSVELLELQHAPKDLGRLQRHVVEIDALGSDGALAQRLGAVIGPAGERQLQIAHEPLLIVVAQAFPWLRQAVKMERWRAARAR